MGEAGSQRAWQISQVQRLIGLPRRDIQRACYSGPGGAGILQPAESSWGRRSYDLDDLAKLYLVARYRERGLTLNEIRRTLEEAGAGRDGPGAQEGSGAQPGGMASSDAPDTAAVRDATGTAADRGAAGTSGTAAARSRWLGLLDAEVDRQRERCARDAEALIQGEALRWAVRGLAARGSAAPGTDAEVDAAVAALVAKGVAANRLLSESGGGGDVDTDTGASSARLARAIRILAGPGGELGGGSGEAPNAGAFEELAAVLDAPGMDLAVEALLGPGSYGRACERAAAGLAPQLLPEGQGEQTQA